jgi:IS30 family transposase
MTNYKHLSEDERYKIQNALDARKSFKQIARELNRDCSTISKEIRARRVFKQTGAFGNPFNDCVFRSECQENTLCNYGPCRRKLCKRCTNNMCWKLCVNYEKKECEKRNKPPYVCNGCGLRNRCTLEKAIYIARGAQVEYKEIMRESRSGVNISEEELSRLNELISPGLKKGQSIHHVVTSSRGKVMWSEKSIYKFVHLGLLNANNFDLPRKVRFRLRKSKHESLKVDTACRINRTYEDYKHFMEQNPDTNVVQMDTVYGKRGAGKCLLTLHFVNAHFMLAYILDARTAHAVNSVFASLRIALGIELYVKLFEVLLGDNGSEFSDPKSIEFDENGEGVSRVYYCDPQQSQQRGAQEVNHTFIRRIIPKGISMNSYCQEHISIMMDNINSYGREIINDRTPYHMFEFLYGTEAIRKLGVNLVPPDDIRLLPALLKKHL